MTTLLLDTGLEKEEEGNGMVGSRMELRELREIPVSPAG